MKFKGPHHRSDPPENQPSGDGAADDHDEFDPEDDEDWEWEEEEGEDDGIEGEEGEPGKRLPTPFKQTNIARDSSEKKERIFASRKELGTERRKREQSLKFVVIALIAIAAIAVLAVGAYSAFRFAENRKTSAEKLSRVGQSGGPAAIPSPLDPLKPSEPAQEAALSISGEPESTSPSPAVDPYLTRSLETVRTLLVEKQNDEAKKLLTNLGRRFPRSADVLVLQGHVVLNNAPATAGTLGRKALEYEPRHKDALDLVSAAFELTIARGLSAESEIKLRDLEIKFYDELLLTSPDWPELLYRAASQRIAVHRLQPDRKDDLAQAITELEHIVELLSADESNPALASAHHQLGRAVKHEGDQLIDEGQPDAATPVYDRSVKEFERALALDPNRVDSLGEIILIRERQDQRERSIEAAETALPDMEAPGSRAKALEMLGVLLQKSNRLDEARQRYEEALEIDGRMIGSLIGIAGVHVMQGEPGSAQERFEQSLQVDPHFLEGYVRLGHFFIQQKRLAEAIGSYERALQVPRQQARTIDMNPSRNLARTKFYYSAASALAWLYMEEENDLPKASKAIDLARQFRDPDPHLLDTLAWIYYRSGNFDKGAAILEKVIEATGGFPSAHYHLAACYAKLDREDEALEAVNRSLEGDDQFSHRADAEALRAELEKR